MKASKRKTTTAVVATVAAAALVLGGTFAWASISQQATNERTGTVNVGGRLHDDFDGTNKDVYVENFTDPLNGGQPIYARVRLDEYMEVGPEAGKLSADGETFDTGRNAESVVKDADINDTKTWTTHKFECDNGDTCFIHDHWSWTMDGGSTVFMPTFNKDKDSLEADINGTYAGLDATDTIHYDDYVKYTTANTGYVFDTNVENHPSTVPVYQKIDDEYYDNDTDTDPNDYTTNDGYIVEQDVTHTAKDTLTADPVISMADWLKDEAQGGKGGKPGNFWVYDTDGWAYWANPIMPGEATGLLLDGIEMYKNPGERCYYAINVVGQFATVGEWDLFDITGVSTAPSNNAKALLEAASKNVPVVTVENKTGKANVRPGDSVEFEASVSVGGTPDATATFEWSVLDADLKEIDSSVSSTAIDATGKLTIDPNETSSTLTIVAKATTHGGVIGVSSVAVSTNVNLVQDLDVEATTYALLLENGKANVEIYDRANGTYNPENDADVYKMVYLRSTDKLAAGDTYNGANIVAVYEDMDIRGFTGGESVPWYTADTTDKDIRHYVTEVSIDTPIKPISTNSWFAWMNNLETITGLDKINTENVTDMCYTFYNCRKLTSVDGVEGWNTTNVTAMNRVFYGCYIAPGASLDLSGWDTSNVIDMNSMFLSFQAGELDVTGWNTSNVTDMTNMFRSCSQLTSIKGIETWNTSNVTTMIGMFYNCKSLTTLDISGANWNTSKVTNMSQMFFACENLSSLTLSTGWDTSNVTDMYRMFRNCKALTSLDCSGWNTSNVTNMAEMFLNCTGFTNLDLSTWNVANVTDHTQFAYDTSASADITTITEPTWP